MEHASSPGVGPSRHVYLGGILLLALLLRAQNLFQPLTDVFSWRQASTAMMAESFHHGSWNVFLPAVRWTGPDPGYQGREFQLYTAVVALLWELTGQREWVGRAVSIGFATWGVFAFHALVRRVWDEQRALASALVLAILPGAIFIDRSFLPDPTMLSLVLTSVWLLVVHLQTDRPLALVLAGLTGALGFATKPPGLVALVPMLYATLSVLRGRGVPGRRIATVVGVLLLAAALAIAHMAWAWHVGHTYPPFHVAGAGKWITTDGFAAWWSRGYFLERTGENLRAWQWTTPLLALAAAGALWPPPRAGHGSAGIGAPGGPRPRWLFHFWALGCVALYAVGARWLNEDPYNLHVFDPLAAAFGGHALVGLARLGRPGPALRVAGAAVVAAGLVLGQQAVRERYAPEHNRQSLALGLALERWSERDELVATIANDVGNPIALYYSRRHGWVFPPPGLPEHPNWVELDDDESSIRQLEALRARGTRWFGVVETVREGAHAPERFWERHRGFRTYLDRTFEIVEASSDYVVYRIPPPDAAPAGSVER